MNPSVFYKNAFRTLAAFVLFIQAFGFSPPLFARQKTVNLLDLSKLVRIADPQISPDGKSIIVLVSRPNFEENRFESEFVIIDAATGRRRVLSVEQRGIGHARWSPDGASLAFLAISGVGQNARRQIFIMPADGSVAPRVLTNATAGVQQFSWRPDGRAIAFSAAEVAEKKTGEERHNDSFEVGSNDYLATAAPALSHIWITPVEEGGEARRITAGNWSIGTSLSLSPLSWSPDGKRIAFVKYESAYSGDTDKGILQIADISTGETRSLTGRKGLENTPIFSPNAGLVTFSAPRDNDPANVSDVFVFSSETNGSPKNITRSLDRSLNFALWMPDGKNMLVGGNDKTRGALWLQPLEGQARRLDLGEVRSVSSVSVSKNGELAFTGSEANRPTELYFMASPAAAPRRLTDFNDLSRFALGKTEAVEWKSSDDFLVNGVLTYPPDFDRAKKYPLVLLLHGGPTATSTEAFSTLAQLMAARGWVVFQPNYRGSDNIGNRFQRAIAGDGGEGPGRDVMEGIAAVKKLGFVDERRIAASGWSFGGFMTAWLIGRYPNQWRAAVAGAAPIDIIDMYSLSDLNVIRRHAITDSPWTGENAKKYFAQSPVAHLSKIRTPTLIMSNSGDSRVPVIGSYKLFHALRDNNVPVKFVVYPIGGHFPGDPVRSRDVNKRWLEWLNQYLAERPARGN
jgi:dipeptidyl aminopeptidase/acylaminoacyl peptidase